MDTRIKITGNGFGSGKARFFSQRRWPQNRPTTQRNCHARTSNGPGFMYDRSFVAVTSKSRTRNCPINQIDRLLKITVFHPHLPAAQNTKGVRSENKEVLQLCRNSVVGWQDAPPTLSFRCVPSGANLNRRSSCLRLAGTCAFRCPIVMWKNSLPSAAFSSTTSPSGGGSNVTPRKFSGDCRRDSDRPTTVGGSRRATT
jgi:hypothetical protein